MRKIVVNGKTTEAESKKRTHTQTFSIERRPFFYKLNAPPKKRRKQQQQQFTRTIQTE